MKSWNLKIWMAAMMTGATLAAPAGVLYNNTVNQTTNILNLANGQEIGDQVFLANYLTFPYLTNFSIEYFSPDGEFSSASHTITADVKFYKNDGTPFNGYATPGTVFYDTGAFSIYSPEHYYGTATNSAVLNFNLSDLQGGLIPLTSQMPSNFTVSVTFNGLGSFDAVGLNVFEPPTTGSNYGDYWLKNAGNWTLMTNSVPGRPSVGFAMQFNASTVPEPGTMCLIGVGLAALAGFARRRRQ